MTYSAPTANLPDRLRAQAERERAAEREAALDGFVEIASHSRGRLANSVALGKARILGIGPEVDAALGRPERVRVFFNPETRMVALRPQAPGVPGGLKLSRNASSGGVSCSLMALCVQYRCTPTAVKRFGVRRVGDAIVFGPLPEVAS